MDAFTALSLAAAVVRFTDLEERLFALATIVEQRHSFGYKQFESLSQCLNDLRDVSGVKIESPLRMKDQLRGIVSSQHPGGDLLSLARVAKAQAVLVSQKLQPLREIAENAARIPTSRAKFKREQRKTGRLWPPEFDSYISSAATVFEDLWQSNDFVTEFAKVSQHRESLNPILLRIINANVFHSGLTDSRSDTLENRPQSRNNDISSIVSINLQQSLQSVAALATKRSGEVISLSTNDTLKVEGSEAGLANIITYNTGHQHELPPSTNAEPGVRSKSSLRSYGNTTLSGSGSAHLGDTNFNAPIHIHQLIFSDEGEKLPSADCDDNASTHQQTSNSTSFNPSPPQIHFLGSKTRQIPAQELENIAIRSVQEVMEDIVSRLYFDEEEYRITDVKEAHQRTFDWIFHLSGSNGLPSFADWLVGGEKLFWINGKAGSGKSTLMKYILQSKLMSHLLTRWAGNRRPVVAPFFFWHLGTPLQKSHEGVLRSLLMQILKKRPDVAQILFPEAYLHLLRNRNDLVVAFELRHLCSAIENLIKHVPEDMALFIMIDGIDEYSGDYVEFCKFLVRLTAHPNIKILVSSRPIPSCYHAFSRFPSLRVQDLTADDIRNYIEDELMSDSLLQEVNIMYPGLAEKIQNELAEKASGVFLWIILVVKNLLIGFQNYDTPDLLLRKIDLLPSDLEDLYDHMFAKMPHGYQEEGSTLLQLTKRAVDVQGSGYTALQASFADLELSSSLSSASSPFCEEIVKARTRAVEGRLRSRCCGLIEVQHDREVGTQEPRVNFLHRTVVEYLNSFGIWEKIQKLKPWTQHDIDMILLQSCVQTMRTHSTRPGSDRLELTKCLGRLLKSGLCYSQNISSSGSESYVEPLHEADTILLQTYVGTSPAHHSCVAYIDFYHDLLRSTMPELSIPRVTDRREVGTILFFATCGLPLFWRRKLGKTTRNIPQGDCEKLLLRILTILGTTNHPEIVERTLANLELTLQEVNPNLVVGDWNLVNYVQEKGGGWIGWMPSVRRVPWHVWLTLKGAKISLPYLKVTLLLIQAGAEVKDIPTSTQELLRDTLRAKSAPDSKDNKDELMVLEEIVPRIEARDIRQRRPMSGKSKPLSSASRQSLMPLPLRSKVLWDSTGQESSIWGPVPVQIHGKVDRSEPPADSASLQASSFSSPSRKSPAPPESLPPKILVESITSNSAKEQPRKKKRRRKPKFQAKSEIAEVDGARGFDN